MIYVLLVIVIIVLISIIACFLPGISIYSLSRGNRDQKVIALTFDDGPNPEITPKILEILNNYKVHASFFVVGKNVKNYPEIIRQIFSAGHLIANHSFTHKYTMFLTIKAGLKEVISTTQAVNEVINKRPRIFRPPYGLRTPWNAKAIVKKGYDIITWDNMTYDYLKMDSSKLAKTIIRHTKPGGIIVLHDGHEGLALNGRNNLIKALPVIIESLQERGYRFMTIDKMLNIDGYSK